MAGKVSHFEVHGRDAKRAQEALDAVAAEPGGIGGGVAGSPAAPMVTFYVEVPDLPAAVQNGSR